jgi:hypothetical protein
MHAINCIIKINHIHVFNATMIFVTNVMGYTKFKTIKHDSNNKSN